VLGYSVGYLNQQSSGIIGDLEIRGSTTLLPIIYAIAASNRFDPNVELIVSGGGSSAGISAVSQGAILLGMSSRQIKPSELDSMTGNPNLVNHTICRDALVMIVNNGLSTSITNIAKIDIKKIFNGTYDYWDEVPGSTAGHNEIVRIGRDSASGTYDYFYEYVMDKTACDPSTTQESSNGAIHDKVRDTPYSIGYAGLGYIDTDVIDLTVDGIEATIESVIDKSYPISRYLYFITDGVPAAGSLVERFINFVRSPIGSIFVIEAGYVPMNSEFYPEI
jgi:phosphate transport system substrate-binding protein